MDFCGTLVWVTDPAHSCFIQCLLKFNTVLSFLERRSDITMLLLCCCSVCKSCLTLCSPMDWSTLGSRVLHYPPEFAHTLVHWVSDAIQPSHPLSPPSNFHNNMLTSPNNLFCPKLRLFPLKQWMHIPACCMVLPPALQVQSHQELRPSPNRW